MKKFKSVCIGGVAVMSMFACTNMLQACTHAAPTVTFHNQQTSSNTVDVSLGMNGLKDDVVALEVSVVVDDVNKVASFTSEVENSYQTTSVQTLANGKERVTLYIVSNDKEAALDLGSKELAILSLSTNGVLTLEKEQTTVKVIEKGYRTHQYDKVEVEYSEGENATDRPEDGTKPPTENKPENGTKPPAENKPENGTKPPAENKPENGTKPPAENKLENGTKPPVGNKPENGTKPPVENKPENGTKPPVEDKPENNNSGNIGNTVVFKDVKNSHWAGAAINKMVNKGIIKGYDDGTFRPNATITRGEFATLLARVLNLDTTGVINSFTDVKADAWYTDGILALYKAGITTGRPDGTFGVNLPITNEEISTMLYRGITSQQINIETDNKVSGTFTDSVSISGYAKEAVEGLAKMGIINGRPDGSFGPKSSTSRAQVAVMLERVMEYTK